MGLKYFSKKPEKGDQDNSIHPEWDQEESAKGTPGEVITVQKEDGTKREVKLLDNPLKLPKRHDHKALDYDFEVSEEDDFDI